MRGWVGSDMPSLPRSIYQTFTFKWTLYSLNHYCSMINYKFNSKSIILNIKYRMMGVAEIVQMLRCLPCGWTLLKILISHMAPKHAGGYYWAQSQLYLNIARYKPNSLYTTIKPDLSTALLYITKYAIWWILVQPTWSWESKDQMWFRMSLTSSSRAILCSPLKPVFLNHFWTSVQL